VLFSSAPSTRNALPRPFWVAAQSSGTRSRVLSYNAAPYAVTASSSRPVLPSRSPSVLSALPRLFWVMAQSNGPHSRVRSVSASRYAPTARRAPGAHYQDCFGSWPSRAGRARVSWGHRRWMQDDTFRPGQSGPNVSTFRPRVPVPDNRNRRHWVRSCISVDRSPGRFRSAPFRHE
jgi:hypothetical protein